MKLSLCIATYNEQDFIHYPLDSAYDLVDEVVIVDGGSDDKTIEIARSYGSKVKIIQADNPKMFHINKQKAIDAAQGEWILQLDADEAISPELKNEINNIIQGKSQIPNDKFQTKSKSEIQNSQISENRNLKIENYATKVAFWIPRKNWFLNRFLEKGGIYPDKTIRLYKKGVAHFPCKDVHENVEVKGEVGSLKSDILHYADPTFERYLNRWNRYTSLDAQKMIKKGETPCLPCYFIGKPIYTFFNIYFRHKGFMDGLPGFIWALFSAIRWWVIYVKVWQSKHK